MPISHASHCALPLHLDAVNQDTIACIRNRDMVNGDDKVQRGGRHKTEGQRRRHVVVALAVIRRIVAVGLWRTARPAPYAARRTWASVAHSVAATNACQRCVTKPSASSRDSASSSSSSVTASDTSLAETNAPFCECSRLKMCLRRTTINVAVPSILAPTPRVICTTASSEAKFCVPRRSEQSSATNSANRPASFAL